MPSIATFPWPIAASGAGGLDCLVWESALESDLFISCAAGDIVADGDMVQMMAVHRLEEIETDIRYNLDAGHKPKIATSDWNDEKSTISMNSKFLQPVAL